MESIKKHSIKFCTVYLAAVLLLFPAISLAQNNQTGIRDGNLKIIQFQNVLKIDDADGSFYFKYPYKIFADEDENIYVLDYLRFLKFSKDGKFVADLVQRGKGPGEISNISHIQVTGKDIIIHNNQPSKIIHIDKNGNLLKEFRLKSSEWVGFSHVYKNNYYFERSEFPVGRASEVYVDVNYDIFSINGRESDWEKEETFPVKTYVVRNGGAMGTFNIAPFVATPAAQGKFLFIVHSKNYRVTRLDLDGKEAVKRFGLTYKPQKIPPVIAKKMSRSRSVLNGKTFRKPIQEFFSDILSILVYKDQLWCLTSTVDVRKGIRVDRFSIEGKPIDSFYMQLPGITNYYSLTTTISGSYLYTLEKPEEAEPYIFKYKIAL